MKKFTLLLIVLIGIIVMSFLPVKPGKDVLIQTAYGNIKIHLLNETPLHRDNFIKLVKEHYYDSTLFHRVIAGFVIQGGDPDSKHAKPGAELGNGDLGYLIPAEFNSKIIHKKGVLAAARDGDYVNPEKSSSACQFYIVLGKIFTDKDLDSIEIRISKQKILAELVNRPENKELKNKMAALQLKNNTDSMKIISTQLDPLVEAEFAKRPRFKFSQEQRKIYTTVGGTPRLDGNYTIFGEVYEGMDVAEKIAAAAKDSNDRPLKDIPMTIRFIE
jgi:peptidylprolyl isomerase